ncbi:MFS transporter [Leifsonia sp. YAF41]|uniref:MFS transporter n=1 Tax=Leifsonia sp. YAF41 TaxID=3233086 RepID=UPI003F9BD8E7
MTDAAAGGGPTSVGPTSGGPASGGPASGGSASDGDTLSGGSKVGGSSVSDGLSWPGDGTSADRSTAGSLSPASSVSGNGDGPSNLMSSSSTSSNATTPPSGPPRGASAFAIAPFRRLWTAGLISDAGDWLLFIALPLVVLQLSGSALATSLAFLLELVPAVLLAPFVARLVDRFDRKALMCTVNVGQALSLIPLMFVRTEADLPLVYLVIVLQAMFSAAFEPAKNALLPDLVGSDRIVSANALVGLNQNLGRLVGGPLGGVLLAIGDLGLVVAVDFVSYLASAVLVATLPRSRPQASGAAKKKSSITRVLRDPRLRGAFVVCFTASIAQGLFVVLFVFFVTETLGGSDADVGLLRGVQAVGAIAAGLLLGFVAAKADMRQLSVMGVAAFALISLVTWNLPFITNELWLYVVLFAIVGAPGVFMGAGLVSILQLGSDDGERGSVFAALGLVMAIGQAIGMLAAGMLQSGLGTVPLLEIQGAVYLVTAILAAVLLPRSAQRAAVA